MDDALSLLRLQIEWGVDEALDASPVDRLRAPEASVATLDRAPPRSRVLPAAPAQLQSTGAPHERALATAMQAQSLDALRDAVAGFDGCALRDTASHLVWAQGEPQSLTLIVGEAPGREEDRTGQPFAGPEGALLDQMLASIGLGRAELMLTPLLPWRPPGGRPPNAGEIAVCLPFLHRLIALLRPQYLLLLGGTAARTLLPGAASRRRQNPSWLDCSIPGTQAATRALVLPSVAEVLRDPASGRVSWAGLRLLRRALDA